jgi:hypothetical protein
VPAREQQQMFALRIGLARTLHIGQCELGPEDRFQLVLPGGLGEADHTIEPVVIGDRQRIEPEPVGLLGQLLGLARAVEEAEIGVAVQLGVGDLAMSPFDRLALIFGAAPGEAGGIAAVGVGDRVADHLTAQLPPRALVSTIPSH